jgi:hypothetical protein
MIVMEAWLETLSAAARRAISWVAASVGLLLRSHTGYQPAHS